MIKLLHKIILPLLIILIVSIAIPIPTAHAVTIEIKDFILKFVVTFTKSGVTETQMTNFLTNQLFPPLRDKLITKLDANFINFDIKKSLRVTDLGNDQFQIYPKIFFSGNTTLTKVQLRNGLDNTIDDWLIIFETELAIQGATNVKYHIHKSFGSIEVNGAN